MSGVKPITSYFKVLNQGWTGDGDGIFDLEVREDEAEVAEDPRELLEEDGPEEEIADEPVLAVEPRKKRQKRTSVLPADNGSNSTINVSRSGRTLNPSTLHGGIQPNRYSTVAWIVDMNNSAIE